MSTVVNTLNLSAIFSLLDDKVSVSTRWTFILFAINFGLEPMRAHVGSSHVLDVKYLSERFRMEPRRLRRDLKILTEQKLIISSLHQKKYRPTRYFEVSGRTKERVGQFRLKDHKRFINEMFGETMQPNKPAQLNLLMQCVLALHERDATPENDAAPEPDKTITLSEAERFLLLVLLMHSDFSGIVYNSKTSVIGKLTGLSKQSINIYLASLRRKGLIRQTVNGLGRQALFVDYGAVHVLNLSHPIWRDAAIFGHFFIIPFMKTSICPAAQILALVQQNDRPSENALRSIVESSVQAVTLGDKKAYQHTYNLTCILTLWSEFLWSKPSSKTQLAKILLPQKNLHQLYSGLNILAMMQAKGEQFANVGTGISNFFNDAIFRSLWKVDPSSLLYIIFPNESRRKKQKIRVGSNIKDVVSTSENLRDPTTENHSETANLTTHELGRLIYAIGALTVYQLKMVERIAQREHLNWSVAVSLPQEKIERQGAVIYLRSRMAVAQDQYYILEEKEKLVLNKDSLLTSEPEDDNPNNDVEKFTLITIKEFDALGATPSQQQLIGWGLQSE